MCEYKTSFSSVFSCVVCQRMLSKQTSVLSLLPYFMCVCVCVCKHRLGMRLIKQWDSWDSSLIIMLDGIRTINTDLNEFHEWLAKDCPVLNTKSSLCLHCDASVHKFILSLRPHSLHRIKENLRKSYNCYKGLSQRIFFLSNPELCVSFCMFSWGLIIFSLIQKTWWKFMSADCTFRI